MDDLIPFEGLMKLIEEDELESKAKNISKFYKSLDNSLSETGKIQLILCEFYPEVIIGGI